MKKAALTCSALLAACGCLPSCVEPTERQRPAAATPAVELPLLPKAPPAPPDDNVALAKIFVDGHGEPALPKWKTRREVDAERLARARATAWPGRTEHIDQYSDYRDKNIAKFFATKPPITTGVRAPAEYEPQQAYLLNWRANYTSIEWRKLFMEIIKGAWGEVPVLMIIKDAKHKTYIEGQLTSNGFPAKEVADKKYITWWQNDSNAIWARDFSPVSIVGTTGASKGVLSFVDFRYYHTRVLDDELPTDLAKEWGINVFRPDLDFEGGNLMTTSDGLCAATRGVLWYNLQLSQSAVETVFADYLGCKTSFFPAPMTGGVIAHIDMYSKYSSDTTVLVGEYTAKQHAQNAKVLDANAALFAKMKNGSGKAVKVIRIPMPNVGVKYVIYKIWRTYTNSVSLTADGKTGVVLIPTYDDETSKEKAAMAAYAKAYPGWKLVKIDSKIVIPGQGAIHCITMQIPKGKRSKMEADPAPLCDKTKYECVVSGCGKISAKGCCDGQIRKYCSGGKLRASDCGYSPQCGWDKAKQWYACKTGGGGDPSGKLPRSCNVAKGLADASVWDGKADQLSPDLLYTGDKGTPDQPAPDQLPDQPLPDQPAPDQAKPDTTPDRGALDAARADAGEEPEEDEGCSCAAGGPGRRPGGGWLLALFGVLLVAIRRRGVRI